jgi:ABC-type antimicrobial peptide transport system permease subunit
MTTPSKRRALWTLVGIALAIGAVVAIVSVVAAGGHKIPGSPTAALPNLPPSTSSWNSTAETALATRSMLALPPQDAQPHPVTAQTAGPPIKLPQPASPLAAGALAQLKELDQDGLAGGDPDVYARVYREDSLPGAPDPRSTGLSSVLVSFRAAGGLPDTGPAADLSVTYQVVEGLIKGTTDSGRFAVVCVLGELTVQDRGQTVAAGVGDCQALRWTGTDWRISPGAMAAPAPCAWPGSVESVEAGYRELS